MVGDSLSCRVTLNPPSISLPHPNFVVWSEEMVPVDSSTYELFPLSFLQPKPIPLNSSLKSNFSQLNLLPCFRPQKPYLHHDLPIIIFTYFPTQTQSMCIFIVILTSRNTKSRLRWIQCYRRASFVPTPVLFPHLFYWLESTMEPGDSV